jgi:hypothetical protein
MRYPVAISCWLYLALMMFVCSHSEAVPVLDSATQHLLEENNQLLSQIAENIETFKVFLLICAIPYFSIHR